MISVWCVTLIVYELSPHDARRWPRASLVRHPLWLVIGRSTPLGFRRRRRRAPFATCVFWHVLLKVRRLEKLDAHLSRYGRAEQASGTYIDARYTQSAVKPRRGVGRPQLIQIAKNEKMAMRECRTLILALIAAAGPIAAARSTRSATYAILSLAACGGLAAAKLDEEVGLHYFFSWPLVVEDFASLSFRGQRRHHYVIHGARAPRLAQMR